MTHYGPFPAAIVDSVFKNYDVRGLVGSQIQPELMRAIGNAFVQEFHLSECVIGRDGRAESLAFANALRDGMLEAGCNVIDVGLVSTPQIKWIVAHHKFPAGAMVTASHNPPAYNGVKFVGAAGLAIGEEMGLHRLKAKLGAPARAQQRGSVREANFLDEFVQFTMSAAGITASDRHIFIDGSGGVFSMELQRLAELGNFHFTFYNTTLDPLFLVHPPNPLDPSATAYAREFCKTHNCIGVVFDADGDRSIFIAEDGEEMPGDYFGAWIVAHTFAKDDGATGTVRDSRALRDRVLQLGGRFLLGRVGHANIQRLMYDNNLRLGTEKSGHVFFRESYFAENGMLGLLLVLKNLEPTETLAAGLAELQAQYFSSPEINFSVPSTKDAIAAIESHYRARGALILIDGVLCEGKDWWVNVRASNTEPLLRLTFEASSKQAYDALETEARTLIKSLGGVPAKH